MSGVVEGLHARSRHPQEGIDSSGEDPGINRGDAGGLAVDADLRFAKSSASATLQFGGQIIRYAGVPELVALLSLGNHVEICLLDIHAAG